MTSKQKDRTKLVVSVLVPLTLFALFAIDLRGVNVVQAIVVFFFLHIPTLCYWSYRWIRGNIQIK